MLVGLEERKICNGGRRGAREGGKEDAVEGEGDGRRNRGTEIGGGGGGLMKERGNGSQEAIMISGYALSPPPSDKAFQSSAIWHRSEKKAAVFVRADKAFPGSADDAI